MGINEARDVRCCRQEQSTATGAEHTGKQTESAAAAC